MDGDALISNRQTLIDQSVAEISTSLAALDDDRRRMFLDWLQAHQREAAPISDATANDRLIARLDELPDEGILQECQLILNEIDWWKDLDEGRLAEIVAADGCKDAQSQCNFLARRTT